MVPLSAPQSTPTTNEPPPAELPEFVILDFETTGQDPLTCQVIEVAAIRVRGFTDVESFSTMVKPETPVPAFISRLTGITDDMVKDAPGIMSVLKDLLAFLGASPIVAQNSNYEKQILERLCGTHAWSFHDSIDVFSLVFAEQTSFGEDQMRTLAGISKDGSHRALKDCRDLLQLLKFAQIHIDQGNLHVPAIVNAVLAPDFDTAQWWWAWLFARRCEELTADLLFPDSKWGPLKALKQRDRDIEPNWNNSLNGPEIKELFEKATLASESNSMRITYRNSQAVMAAWANRAFRDGEKIALEAPTGTGKSLAYLVPAIANARRSGVPVVISTKSKTLQDQLVSKDVPLAAKILNDPGVIAVTVKGQDNYLCVRKTWSEFLNLDPHASVEERHALAFLLAFVAKYDAGEIDSVSNFMRQRPALQRLLDKIRSKRETTIGERCPFFNRCHYFNSARRAYGAHVVITNHSLLTQWPEHLPRIRNLVIDEGHHLESDLTEGYSMEWEPSRTEDIIRELSSSSPRRSAVLRRIKISGGTTEHAQQLATLCSEAKAKIDELVGIVRQTALESGEDAAFPIEIDIMRFKQDHIVKLGIENVMAKLSPLADATEFDESDEAIGEKGLDIFKSTHFHFLSAISVCKKLLQEETGESVSLVIWNEKWSELKVSSKPISVAQISRAFAESFRSVVLTSATLTSIFKPNFLLEQVGLPLTRPIHPLPSPFDLENQATLFIPRDAPSTDSPDHQQALAEFTANIANELGGKTLLLMTSRERMRRMVAMLEPELAREGIEVFDSDRHGSQGVEHFKRAPSGLLVGLEKYGEGIDIPGKQLSCVILERTFGARVLGPLHTARKERTRFPTFDYDFPIKMLWLKQRIGRLIRSTEDKGWIIIFDPRFYTWKANSQRLFLQDLRPIRMQPLSCKEILEHIAEQAVHIR